ncbi:MAG: hypothetical protein JXX29_18450 [Deltaproteobacteria bacterium]|nr:hypothetical protein [Deltaproteobacteria bacterium]MBN2673667.1 hypothetical protein [Deltaproteobacteria bacterium]
MTARCGFSLMIIVIIIVLGCNPNKPSADEAIVSPPPPTHDGMCVLKELGEASDAIEKKLPNNQYVSLQGMSSPKTLVWQDMTTQQIYYATKIMGAEGKLFYMAKLKTGEKPSIKSNFLGNIMLWQHLPTDLLRSMKTQFKNQWGVEIDEKNTYIILADEKPKGCK